ncbi:MAG: hypothetical protein NZ480_03280 [Bdellovibrionaceae bacterium]|nr:hypothetical protein [Pseudobdellovibrionaceae bacterium]MDW8190086.1 hypothetical protein [Pseudobdellovibrionaceae bacterium]
MGRILGVVSVIFGSSLLCGSCSLYESQGRYEFERDYEQGQLQVFGYTVLEEERPAQLDFCQLIVDRNRLQQLPMGCAELLKRDLGLDPE